MRKEKILELVKILESHEIDEIEISRWGQKIRISKNSNTGISTGVEVAPAPQKAKKVISHSWRKQSLLNLGRLLRKKLTTRGLRLKRL